MDLGVRLADNLGAYLTEVRRSMTRRAKTALRTIPESVAKDVERTRLTNTPYRGMRRSSIRIARCGDLPLRDRPHSSAVIGWRTPDGQ